MKTKLQLKKKFPSVHVVHVWKYEPLLSFERMGTLTEIKWRITFSKNWYQVTSLGDTQSSLNLCSKFLQDDDEPKIFRKQKVGFKGQKALHYTENYACELLYHTPGPCIMWIHLMRNSISARFQNQWLLFLTFWLTSTLFKEYNITLKPFQNKKGQKNLRYPTKKQSFSLEKHH